MKMYGCACDNCKEDFKEGEMNYALFPDKITVKDQIIEADWITENGKHYCPDCVKYNDEDELVIDKNRFKEKVLK